MKVEAGKHTRGLRKTAVILSVGAVSPIRESVDAPGSILKYNTDGFYVDFRSNLMNPFPFIRKLHETLNHVLMKNLYYKLAVDFHGIFYRLDCSNL